jgi:YhcH/YjgK/YiaL family protein
MIIDRITNAHLYSSLSPAIQRAFEYLQQTDLVALANGKYEIDGENMYISVQEYDTKPKEQGKWEAHRRYIDIQYMIRGTEQIGCAHLAGLAPMQAYDASRDVAFFSGEGGFSTMQEGMFMVLFPEDAHMPCISVNELTQVKKAVVKVLVA